ncbi:hypothetical protein MHYP_G00185070 [Metynnis hypsauchen]
MKDISQLQLGTGPTGAEKPVEVREDKLQWDGVLQGQVVSDPRSISFSSTTSPQSRISSIPTIHNTNTWPLRVPERNIAPE